MRGQLIRYIKDDEDLLLCRDAINDAIDSLWLSCILVSLGQFMGGPIQPASLQLAQGSERATIVSIPDPAQLTVANWGTSSTPLGPNQLPPRTELFAITYVTESGSETLPDFQGVSGPATGSGTPLTVNLAAGQLSNITPPSFPNIPFPAYAPAANPIGWNLYASGLNSAGVPDPNGWVKQNDVPIPFNQIWFEQPNGLLVQGQSDAEVGLPQYNSTADNIFYIRVLEVQNPDSTWTRWMAGNLDGLLFDRMVKSIAPQTTYQRYAYDFINGNTLEIRPFLGQGLSPRMFFVVKPRRLLYGNSPLPFTNIVYNEFIKMFAAAQICMSNHEYTAADQCTNAAEKSRTRILEGLNTQATTKQKSITPYMTRTW